ncbi:MAG: hypothetical protein GY851_31700 [bacterium]|nr:hypothetical protein [bacterium]
MTRQLFRMAAAAVCVVLCASCAHFGGPARIAQPGHGIVEVSCSADEWTVILLGDKGTLSIESDAGKRELPVGDYIVTRCAVSGTDKDGVTWRVSGAPVRYGDAGAVSVLDNQKATVKVGPPFTAELAMRKSGSNRTFQMGMTDQAGLAYRPSGVTRSGGRPKPPAIEIRDPKGDVVAKGSFRYG